ncbi:MAG TPA: 3-oxoacyl-[acyl-carrier-protein] synthase III C-terminal domain-containing protein [Kofleriaceae bacterium]|nr:3-oxoacyl-[acyl-carrier-protein] synthase III C-terminal domain-containing protein [Kofleriaceae bacterium]
MAGLSEDERLVVGALERLRNDPFQGTRRRHVIGASESALDIEVIAGRDALTNAGLTPSDIDLLLTHSGVPDYLGTNTACSVHLRLGLPSHCFSLQVEASSNSFLMQAVLAEQAIRAGAARYALLVQSSTYSQILPRDAENSPWMGDGATAVVIGPVREGLGFASWEHRTDGSLENTFVAGIPGKHWFDDGRVIGYPANPPAARRMFLQLATFAKDVCGAAMAKANVSPADVAFYASHQGTAWFREVTQSALGLTAARFVDTFAETSSVYSSNIPLCLYIAEREGLLASGDLVLMFSGGGGTTYTCGIMRWSM